MKQRNKAAFIDRDGNLIHETGYLNSVNKVRLYSRSIKALKLLKDRGYKVIVVTNQSGVARGYITEAFVKSVHKHIDGMLKKHGLKIDGYYYCPHHAKKAVIRKYLVDCDCRKPKLGMIKAAQKRFGIDLKESFMIGDKLTDVHMGKNAKMRTALVMTGYGEKEKLLIKEAYDKPDVVAKDFYQAVRLLLK